MSTNAQCARLFRKVHRARLESHLRFKPGLDQLEDRTVPATLLVNDNWSVVTDVGPSGLSAGDTVDNSSDVGAQSVTGTFGVTAFGDINAAIGAANDGDTVRVLEGDYSGVVTIDQSIKLEGANAGMSAAVHADARGPESTLDGAITVQADNVTIDGFEIVGGSDIGGDVAGIFFASGSSDITVQNNVITGEGAGRGILSAFNGENNDIVIQQNDIGNWTSGVFNQSNEGVVVLSNVIHDNVAGVANDFVEDVEIRGNNFLRNDEGVAVFESTDVKVNFNNLVGVEFDSDDGNLAGVNNYGGPAVDASFNYWGTTDPDEIADLVSGDVVTTDALTAAFTATSRIFSDGDVTLVVDTATGAWSLTLADGTVHSGDGARIQKGKLKIHEQTSLGKLDVKGDADGDISVNVRGKNKTQFDLKAKF